MGMARRRDVWWLHTGTDGSQRVDQLVVRGLTGSSPSLKDLEVTVRVLLIRPADHTKAGGLVHCRDPVPHSHMEPSGSPGKWGLIKEKGKESILIQLNAKLHRKKRAQSQPGKEELQAGFSQSQISSEDGQALEHEFLLQHTGCLWQSGGEKERGAVLLHLFPALLKQVWPNCAELWHPYFKSDIEMFRKQPNKS